MGFFRGKNKKNISMENLSGERKWQEEGNEYDEVELERE